MNPDFVHLICTRHGVGIYDPNYFEHRFLLLKTFTLPSLRSQTSQNFRWLIFVGKDMPVMERNELGHIVGDYKNAVILDEGVYSTERLMKYAETLAEQEGLPSNRTMVLTSRIDDDDCWRRDTVEQVQTFMDYRLHKNGAAKEGALLTFPLGYWWILNKFLDKNELDGTHIVKEQSLRLFNSPCYSTSVHVLSRLGSNITCVSYPHGSIMDELRNKGCPIFIENKDKPMWLVTRHKYADSSIIKFLKYPEINISELGDAFFDKFGIDKDNYAGYITATKNDPIIVDRRGRGLTKEKGDYRTQRKELLQELATSMDITEAQRIRDKIRTLDDELRLKSSNLEPERLRADLEATIEKLLPLVIEMDVTEAQRIRDIIRTLNDELCLKSSNLEPERLRADLKATIEKLLSLEIELKQTKKKLGKDTTP